MSLTDTLGFLALVFKNSPIMWLVSLALNVLFLPLLPFFLHIVTSCLFLATWYTKDTDTPSSDAISLYDFDLKHLIIALVSGEIFL